ncbi:MAG TPA: 5-formyltetrahydrofolate cyclo-ligase [Microlunatus sp.]|nr:5-formyltetrahydrofolate cyclo-ligase [Microlunatus sp.]
MSEQRDDPATAAAKRALRVTIRQRRAARSATARAAGDAARTDRLLAAVGSTTPATVAAYLSSGSEPDSTELIDRLSAAGAEVLLPASAGGTWAEPAWARWEGPDRLREGPLGILEPEGAALPGAALARAGLVLCPGLAGTPRGERLGRGGGWYDRVLPWATGRLLLLLNDDEVIASLPTGPLDRRVDAIVTPSRLLVCDPGPS